MHEDWNMLFTQLISVFLKKSNLLGTFVYVRRSK
jgi:hypothetical protein